MDKQTLTIKISGPCGSGKTTVANIIKKALEQYEWEVDLSDEDPPISEELMNLRGETLSQYTKAHIECLIAPERPRDKLVEVGGYKILFIEKNRKIYFPTQEEGPNSAFAISESGVWISGLFDSVEAARLAFELDPETLDELWSVNAGADRFIGIDDVRAYMEEENE